MPIPPAVLARVIVGPANAKRVVTLVTRALTRQHGKYLFYHCPHCKARLGTSPVVANVYIVEGNALYDCAVRMCAECLGYTFNVVSRRPTNV